MKKIVTYFFSALLLLNVACKNPMDKEFNRETAEQDFARLVKLGKIDSADANIMAHFMVEHDLIGAQVLEIGASYRDILEESKRYWQESKGGTIKNEDLISEEDLYQDVLKLALNPDNGKVDQSAWSSSLKYSIDIENISQKEIRAIKGKFIFVDPFGEPLHVVQYKYLNKIQPGQKKQESINFRLLHAISANTLIQFSEQNPFTVKWKADSVVFN